MSSVAPKRKTFTVEEKSAIIWRLEAGESNTKLASEFGVAHSTISTIWKNRESIRTCFESQSIKIKRIKTVTHDDIDQALLEWFKLQRSQNVPINGPMLQQKANEFGKLFKKSNYNCSESWIYRFRVRHGIVFSQISGEANSAPSAIAEDWLKKVWPTLRAGYADNEIFNVDETGLFFRLTQNKTLKFKGEKCKGGKLSKDRITVLVAANMDGSVKRKLLVIGKFQKPRCFKNVQTLPVRYSANTKAWMTSALFEKELRLWNSELLKRNKKILLLVDNCPSHMRIQLQAIRVEFLPPNTTSILQPIDQGIIKNLKHHYRKKLVMQMIQLVDEGSAVSLKISILDAIVMIAEAWDNVTANTIKNCFKHAGLIDCEFNSDDDLPLAQLVRNVNVENLEEDDLPIDELAQNHDALKILASPEEWALFERIDDDLLTVELPTDDDIVNDIIFGEISSDDEEVLEAETEEAIFVPPTIAEAIKATSTIKHFLWTRGLADDTLKNAVGTIDKQLNKMLLNEKNTKQTSIRDFFKHS